MLLVEATAFELIWVLRGSRLQTTFVSYSMAYSLMVLTSLINLIAIQLSPLSTRSSNNLGAKLRKSCGLLQPNSHTTLTIAAVTLGFSRSSINRSLILGYATLRVSGYTKASLYKVTIVFLRTAGLECVIRGRRSESTERASEGVMICGRVIIGRDIVVIEVEVKSYQTLADVAA